jgi:hypothetical protein
VIEGRSRARRISEYQEMRNGPDISTGLKRMMKEAYEKGVAIHSASSFSLRHREVSSDCLREFRTRRDFRRSDSWSLAGPQR